MVLSDKITKVLVAGLATAGLTLGAAMPALAEVNLKGDSATLSSTVVNVGGSPWLTKLTVPVSYDSSDEVERATSVFSTMGENYVQKLVLIETPGSGLNDGAINASFDTSADYGESLYEGTWSIGDVSIIHGKDEKTSASIDKTFTLNDGEDPDTSSVVDEVTVNFPKVTVTTTKPVDRVVLYYLSPVHELLKLSMQKANSTEFVGSFNDIEGFILLGGDYELQAIMTSDVDSDTGNAATAEKYVLTTSVIEYRDNVSHAPMLRLYNPNSGEHVYTASERERDLLVKAGWKYEGIGFYAMTSGEGTYRAINRLYNGLDHHYATDEEASLLESLGWKNEGVSFYSNDYVNGFGSSVLRPRQPVYRLCNRNATVGAHHYTTSAGERDLLVAAGWRDEGIGFYGVDISKLQDTLIQ